MSSGRSELEGPDLTQGIPVAQLKERDMILGHAHGEAFILARCEGKLRAVGATCTHYGAPLIEGRIVDGTLRCPWHHAAFDLATGAAVRPPALADLPACDVEERDGRAVAVPRQAGSRPPPRRSSSRHPESVVVAGGGAAGAAAVESLRKEGYAGPVTLISGEETAPLDRPNLSKDYLAGTAGEDWLALRTASWYEEQGITLRTGTFVRTVDARGKRVVLGDGSSVPYGALLLATGADPIRMAPEIEGPVHYLRNLADCQAIIRHAAVARRAVVLGASFIGLEVAASLRTRGLDVTVVAPESQPLERVLGVELGSVIRELHERRGVTFRLGRLARDADASGVLLDDGTRISADLIVAGLGVRPNVQLAEQCGLAIDRGVLVNEYLETSAPVIYAAGDIARWPDPHSGRAIRVEHWVVAQRQGATAARNILGAQERFQAVPFFWSAHYDVSISYVGHAEQPDNVEIDGDPRALDCAVRYFEGGRAAAVATIGRDDECLGAEVEMERALRQAAAASAS